MNKFNTFRLADDHILKLGWSLYIKRNKFIWIAILYSVLCLANVTLLTENISLIILASCILFSNLSRNKWSEIIGEIHLVVLIILMIFNWGYLFPVAMNGLFCSALCILLLSNNKRIVKNEPIKNKFISAKTLLVFRHFLFGQWQSSLCLAVFFILPKLIIFFRIKVLYTWVTTINYNGIFILLIIFELLQDVNLEKHSFEYNRFRFYRLSGTGYFKRILFSRYASLGFFSILVTSLVNLFNVKLLIIQITAIIILVLWYKFFEEKALMEKRKPTWQLSYIRCWAPTTLLFLISFAPQLMQLIEKMKGN
ncbi:hypothetical protein I6N95_18000 [Vagococcus sp. BWB3-3]|uniref:Uncharacterized protein n=1 Tax=Vagococcus allomyrinae TaxID=2794353 RepID=A0A940SX57_9ENTE|nr:hypothetical protein [Vagococcus allomyrinae]MBP1042911.1 hypothetical protein [Vagococcus allomyrinae]